MYDEMNGSNGSQENSAQPVEPGSQQSEAVQGGYFNQQNMYSQPADGQQNAYDQQNGYYQQGMNSQQGVYTQNAYDNYYASADNQQSEGGSGFGIASLVLGILALITFCTVCFNVPLAILAIIFAIIQLVKGNGKGLAIGGLITSGLSIVACIVFYLVIGLSVPKFSDMSDMDSFMQQYPELYQELEDYNYDMDDFDFDDSDDDDTF